MSEATNYTVQDVSAQIKPLSKNPVAAFFQRIGRGWLSAWYRFSDNFPRLSKFIYQFGMFTIFSQGVTIFQYILFMFLPYWFGMDLARVEWLWPGIELFRSESGQVFYFYILGKPIVYNNSGVPIIGGGLGYFFSFLIATFLAQCINFPLQRNITFRSHGNPYYQAMWYFIGWIFIQPFCDGIGSLYTPLVNGALGFTVPVWLKTLLDTFVMGGVSMAIFFVVFLIIFPDYDAVEKRTKAKLERMKAKGAAPEKIAKVEAALKDASMKAKLARAEKAQHVAITQANAKAIKYFAIVKRNQKLGTKLERDIEREKEAFAQAIEAIKIKEEAIKNFQDARQEAATQTAGK